MFVSINFILMIRLFFTSAFILFAFCVSAQQLFYQSPSSTELKSQGVKKKDGNFSRVYIDTTFWESRMDHQTQFSINGRDTSGTVFTELITDHIKCWRISFSGAISNETDDSTNVLNQFLSTGGNATLRFDRPLLFYGDNKLNHSFYFSPKVSTALPALGTSVNDPLWNVDVGLEWHYRFAGTAGNLAFAGRIRGAVMYGSSELVGRLTADGRDVLGYSNFSGGLIVKDLAIILVNFPISWIGPDDPIDQLPVTVSVGANF